MNKRRVGTNLRTLLLVSVAACTDCEPPCGSSVAGPDCPENEPPAVSIDSPGAEEVFAQGESISFRGTATDPEDGALSGPSLEWHSSVAGPIGSGTSFNRNDLEVGPHLITLTATDGEGATGEAWIPITIAEENGENPPPDAELGAIVFTRETSSTGLQLFAMRPDGTDVRQFTPNAACAEAGFETGGMWPRWSRDGSGILFIDTFSRLFLAHADGSACTVLVDDSRQVLPPAAWDPAGDRVAFCWEGADAWGISLLDLSTGSEEIAYSDPRFFSGSHCDLDWSPGGSVLSFTLDTETEIGDTRVAFLSLLDLSVLEPEVFFGAEGAAWSPVSDHLAYVRHTTHASIAILDLDTFTATTIELDDMEIVRSLRWAPDGEHLVFDASPLQSGDFDVYAVNVRTGTRTQLAATGQIEATPDWRQ